MKISWVGSGFLALAFCTAGAAQAQNSPTTPLIQPPLQVTPNNVPALPFVYTLPLPPVTLAIQPTSPVQPFVESPVGAYGRLATPITPPAAPVVGNRSTPLVPNGVLLSNGAIVDPNTVWAPAQPILNGPSFETQQIQSTFGTVDGTIESRLNGGARDQPSVLVPGTTGAELMPTPPSPFNPPTSNTGQTRPAPPRAGTSLAEVIEVLGNPVVTLIQNDGQTLLFKDGERVFMKDGVVVRQVSP